MTKIAVFTIASKNYLAYVRTLMKSVAKIHPEYKLFLCLADCIDDYFDVTKEPYDVIQAKQLDIPYFSDMTLRYDIMELNTAVKPFMFRWLFDNTDVDIVIYLDPDVCVYSRFDRLESLFKSYVSLVLTPHITRPIEDDKFPNDYHMLQAGIFNLGFIAARRCDETMDFIGWWGRKLYTQCIADFNVNLFVDQKWCDLAPCFLDNLRILKDPGYNVAYWNLAQRHVVFAPNQGWLVNDSTLVFFHFSGVGVGNENIVSKHQDRFAWRDMVGCQPLFVDYLNELITNGWYESNKWPYYYNSLSGGFVINILMRYLYRSVNRQPVDIDPVAIENYLVNMCNHKAEGIPGDKDILITRLMLLIYKMRPDLQAMFSLFTPEGQRRYAEWFDIAGEREYGLPPCVARQEHIQGADYLEVVSKKKLPEKRYRILVVLDAAMRKTANYVPEYMRKRGSKLWLQIKTRIIGTF